MKYKFSLPLLAIFTIAACAPSGTISAETNSASCDTQKKLEQSEAGLSQEIICIKNSKGKMHIFTTEMAKTSAEQAKGLMFRTELPADRAMLFPFNKPRMASFWMKNTVIPLDIIFVKSDGIIQNIAENTVPYDETPVLASAPVTAVLEIQGGLSAKLGIKAGDKIHASSFTPTAAPAK
ncbi:hypothetical protein LPB140_11480 [Sphingorhabdus lutea]|uniref:DUF192 domain-containing protein n=1 Tax=Sphingorhabdus lutea TaxID=1913578 RepID=A0A1L3JDU6_9SPHN|nr:DUF192 domain-containing protein [Sphingorhabdus lutea]APG63302.1 hypothetical protein LPB140_11480 [Sphingorhabdus lutea]